MPKCKICKKQLNKEDAYLEVRVTKGGNISNNYYCNQKELETYNKEQEYKALIYDTLKDYMGYEINQILPSVILKEIVGLHNGYSYKAIYNVIRDMEKDIRYWMTLDGKFNTEYSKAKYLLSMLGNNINDVYIKLKHEAKVENERETQHVDIDVMDYIEEIKVTRKVNDISSFLD